MSTYDRHKPMSQKLHDTTPSSHQAVKFVTASAIGAGSLFLSGLILTGTVIGLAIATPLLVLFSPILVPAGIVTFLLATGFVFSGGFGVAAVSALSWIYNYAKGNHPVGADSLDQARMMVANTAWGVTEKAKEVGQYVQHKAQEVTGFD